MRFFLSRPGTIELLNLAFLSSGGVRSIHVGEMLPDTDSVFQEALGIVSQVLPAQAAARLPPNVVALAKVSEDNFVTYLATTASFKYAHLATHLSCGR